jgi:predicted ArsR family transcriptional regulator
MSGTLRATLPLAVDGEPSFRGFAPTKRAILMHLKRGGEADLATLARSLSISKMAVYKHVQELEESGLVERDVRRGGVGRPRLILRLAPEASSLFPNAYASVTCALLKYIEETMGRKAVEAALRSRHKQILPQYQEAVTADDLAGRVHALAKLRDQEGYMAEMREGRRGQFELFEYNCPIVAIAQDYWEACTVENELFRKVLRADVETTHRVVAGDHVCRFLIKPRAKGVSP